MPTKYLNAPSDSPAASGLPQIDPVALTPRSDPFDDPRWLFEPKYDGLRGLLYSSRMGCEIRSSQPDFKAERFADLCTRVAGVLGGRDAILDGEVVALNRQGKPVLPDPARGQGFVAFAASDLLWLDCHDLRPRPLDERKLLLADLLPVDTGPLYKILTLEEHGRALFSAIRKMDLRGIVAKRNDDPYGPSTIWYEVTNPGYGQGEGEGDGRAEPFRPRRRARRSGREG